MKEFDTSLKLNSLVLRHMTVSLDRKPKEYVDKSKTDSPVIENDNVSTSDQNKDGDDKATADDVDNNLDSNTVKIDEEK